MGLLCVVLKNNPNFISSIKIREFSLEIFIKIVQKAVFLEISVITSNVLEYFNSHGPGSNGTGDLTKNVSWEEQLDARRSLFRDDQL